MLARLIEIHDRQQFRVIGVAFGPKTDDELRRRLSGAFDTFLDISGVSDPEAGRMLVTEGVDIAVDLAGHTEHARTGLLALRPAPVQVSYLGYPGTMGASFIDYLFADRWVLPEANQPFYSEKIAYLPDTYQVNGDWAPVLAPTISRRAVGLPDKGFVFFAASITPARLGRTSLMSGCGSSKARGRASCGLWTIAPRVRTTYAARPSSAVLRPNG